MVDVTVVGSGPNGLAAAVTAARAGLEVRLIEGAAVPGGGLRTAELTLPGFRHDVCSAVHPAAAASPFFASIGLEDRLEWIVPELSYAHPLPGGAGLAWRDLDRTVDGLGRDGRAWRQLIGPLVDRIAGVVDFTGHQLLRWPADPVAAFRFAVRVLDQGTRPLWNADFRGETAPALFTGVVAHAAGRMPNLASAGAGLLLAAHAHAGGWPVPAGGSQAIADALLADFAEHGGTVETGRFAASIAELEPSRAILLDTSPEFLRTAELPAGYARALGRYCYGSGVAKVDLAVGGPIPWADAAVGLAPTVHLGGTRAEIAAAENEVARGRMPERPYILLAQPGVVDPSRAPAPAQTVWAYLHVPAGSTRHATELVVREIERHAPGFRDTVLASASTSAAGLADYNPNYPGGDIYTGALTLRQMLKRPVVSPAPWRTPLPGVYLCSSATPPGPAVHGMNGWFAARLALADRFGIELPPL
ncbi:phytoene desaturase family protein [Agromyces archimandritae]|uniref:NAD(P)/FAD-dependent oxidoreductase n=1 Tax=Agromyces archimandritae TaxID=2781962 RepID=A0A975FLD5_9MICO|nr:NAD(P)/FAD-dependent oxidoreductase [Agromyces archimandritae]QTX03872.1 NAD(P)/FAD-dependent oxidoreductase [Agromyces archimandritae]